MLLSAALTLQASAYTVTTVAEAPQWQIDWSGNCERPDWTEPGVSHYENWTILMVQIEDALKPYVSDDDLMAIFVNNELRGLASPAVIMDSNDSDDTIFLLKAWGDEDVGQTVTVTLKYYNSQLKNIFSLSDNYTVGEEMGIDEDFIPPFTLGAENYPVTTTLDAAAILAKAGITPAEGDMVAAFVGDECRGVGEWPLDDDLTTIPDGSPSGITVFQRDADETVVLKYYDSNGNCVITFADGNYFLTGDANGDGHVDVGDVMAIINYMAEQPNGVTLERADVNGDGSVDVGDVMAVINIMAQ